MRIEIKLSEEYKDTEMFYEDGKLNIIDKKWLAEHDKQIRAEVIDEIINIAHCEEADCFECAFGSAEGCLLKEQNK